MSRMLADLVAYAKQYIRSPVAAFLTIAFPVVLLLLFGAIFASPEQVNLQVHVQNLDSDSQRSLELIDAISGTGVDLVLVSPSENLEDFIRDQSIPAALRIPAGFHAEVEMALAGNPLPPPTVTLHGDTSSAAFQTVEGIVSGAVTELNFALSGADAVVVYDTQGLGGGAFVEPGSGLDFYLPGIMGIMVLTPIFWVSAISAEYRSRNYFKLLATTPLRKWEYLFSRTIIVVALIFVSTLLMVLLAWLVFGQLFVLTPIAIGLIAAGSVLFVAIGMALGNLGKDPEAATAFANIIFFPMMFLTGTFIPLEIMPDFIQTVSRFLPLTYFNEGISDTLIFGNFTGALENLAVVAGLAVIVFGLTAWSMKWRAE